MQDNLSSADVIEWLRRQSRKFSDMADQIESAFRANGSTQHVERRVNVDLPSSIRTALGNGKARRLRDLARTVEASEQAVNEAIDSTDSGIVRGERGWIMLGKAGGDEDE